MFNRTAFENSRPDGMGVIEIVPKESAEDTGQQFVPLTETVLTGEIAGPLASLCLRQTFRYSKSQCAVVVEALYRFPLPGDAAVTKVEVRFGDVVITAALKEREAAEAEYKQAKQEGRQAALASRESPDVFTLQIAGVAPDEDVIVETSYVQLARTEGLGWSIRVPLTTAPRYVRSDELTSRHAHGQPLALLRDPGHRFSLDVVLRDAAAIESATHALVSEPVSGGLRVTLRDVSVVPDRDCVLSWVPPQDADRPALKLLVHRDADASQLYFVGLVTPPAAPVKGKRLAREIVLLVDHSGSMEGPKWMAADWAVKKFLSDLDSSDRFNLGLFHDTTAWLANSLRPGNPGEIDHAVRFLETHRDSGGTELGVALEQGLGFGRTQGDYARHVLIITDAQASDEGRVLRLAEQESEHPERRRINVLCIDAAPNSFLANTLAERGGGVSHFLTSSPDEEDITTALDRILEAWGPPAAANLALAIDRPGVQAAGPAVRANDGGQGSTVDLGDLPRGQSMWVAGRIPMGGAPDLRFSLRSGGEEWANLTCDLSKDGIDLPGIKALFGARRIGGLEFLVSANYAQDQLAQHIEKLGYSPQDWQAEPADKSPKVYAENERAVTTARLKGLLVRESLEYRVASSETAFVAVRQEKGERVEGTVVVANALPAGWSHRFLSGPVMPMAVPSTGAMPRPLLNAMRDMSPVRPVGRIVTGSIKPRTTAEAAPRGKAVVLFSGKPQFEDTRAMVFDSSRPADMAKLGAGRSVIELRVRFPGGTPKIAQLDPDLAILLYVGDLASPVAKVKMVDLVRQGLARPVHLSVKAGQIVQVVIVDPKGVWAAKPPAIEISLGMG